MDISNEFQFLFPFFSLEMNKILKYKFTCAAIQSTHDLCNELQSFITKNPHQAFCMDFSFETKSYLVDSMRTQPHEKYQLESFSNMQENGQFLSIRSIYLSKSIPS